MKLKLDVFEGPLDLLLYLIKKNNLEISRLSMARIAEQYLQYLDSMQELNVDIASEFLLIAAELSLLKSKELLPAREASEIEEEELAAGELVKKLRAYQKFKLLAEKLNQRQLLGRDVFKRGSFDFSNDDDLPVLVTEPQPDPVFEVSSYDLVKAFNEILNRLPKSERQHRVIAERVSVTDRVYEILDMLRRSDHVLFTDLFYGHYEKIDYVVTFLAILEMAKLKMAHIYQTENYGPIRLQQRLAEVVTNDIALTEEAGSNDVEQ